MHYLLLLYHDPGEVEAREADPEIFAARKLEHADYIAQLRAAGAFVGGNALESVATATTVRCRDGRAAVTDGPFAETKEQLGGYYLIEAAHLDDALEWAQKNPESKYGAVEVRPIRTV